MMSDKARTVLHIDEDAAALLDTLTSPRGKGECVSSLIRDAARRRQLDRQDLGILERIEMKIDLLLSQQGADGWG